MKTEVTPRKDLTPEVVDFQKKIKKAILDNNLNKNSIELSNILLKGLKNENKVVRCICAKAYGYAHSTGQVYLTPKQIWVLAFNLAS